MAEPISEVLIEVDRSAVDAAAPTKAAIDRGCSLSKFLYVAKDAALTGATYTFHCALFRNEDFEDGLRFLREKALLPSEGKLRVTGAGCDMYAELITEVLGLQIEFVREIVCNIRGLYFLLAHAVTPEDLFYPKVEIHDDTRWEKPAIFEAISKKAQENAAANDNPDPSAHFPCVFLIFGSGTVCKFVDSDGRGRLMGMNMVGGRTLLGLGKALVGINSYDEIMELAGKGDVSNVDTTIGDFLKEDPNSPYGRFPPTLPLFPFGKMIDSDQSLESFGRADRAAALVRLVALNIHALVRAAAKAASVTRVIIGGNGVQSEVIRQMIVDQDKLRGSGGLMDPKFLKTGHTGAFGAMITAAEDASAFMQL